MVCLEESNTDQKEAADKPKAVPVPEKGEGEEAGGRGIRRAW